MQEWACFRTDFLKQDFFVANLHTHTCTHKCRKTHKAQSSFVLTAAVAVETARCRVTVVWKPANKKLWPGLVQHREHDTHTHTQVRTELHTHFNSDWLWSHDQSVSFHPVSESNTASSHLCEESSPATHAHTQTHGRYVWPASPRLLPPFMPFNPVSLFFPFQFFYFLNPNLSRLS